MRRTGLRRLSRLFLYTALGLLTLACDPGALGLPGLGNPRLRIRELPASEVAALVREEGGEIVQLRDPDEGLPGIRGAHRLSAEAPLPDDLVSPDRWLIVVAEDHERGLRMAARLTRAGAEKVALAVGPRNDLLALAGIRTAGRGGASGKDPERAPEKLDENVAERGEEPKPGAPERHPSH